MVKGFKAGEWSPHNQRCKCRTDPDEPMRCDDTRVLEAELNAEVLHKLAILLRLFGKKDLIICNGGGHRTALFWEALPKRNEIINPFKAVLDKGLHLSLCTYYFDGFDSFEDQYMKNFEILSALNDACGRPGLFDDILNDDSCLLIGTPGDLRRKKALWWNSLSKEAQEAYKNPKKGIERRDQPWQYTQEERSRGGTQSMASKGFNEEGKSIHALEILEKKGFNEEGKHVHAVEAGKRSAEVSNAIFQLKHQLASENHRCEIVCTTCGDRSHKFLTDMYKRDGDGNIKFDNKRWCSQCKTMRWCKEVVETPANILETVIVSTLSPSSQ
jgi:hypothetical protein